MTQLALTAAIALGGMWAIVNEARTSEGPVEPSNSPPTAGVRSMLRSSESRLIDPRPEPAIIFLVGSERAAVELGKALALDAIIRSSTHNSPLDASVAIVESEEHAYAVKTAARDTSFHEGMVTAVEVIDLR